METWRNPQTITNGRAIRSHSHRQFVALLVAGCVISGLIWFFMISPFWRVTEIRVEGNQRIARGEIEASADAWKGKNLFFLDVQSIGRELTDKLFVESVAVDKVYPNVLRLLIAERQRSVVASISDNLLTIDSEGFAAEPPAQEQLPYFQNCIRSTALANSAYSPVISIESVSTTATSTTPTTGEQIVDAATVRLWLETARELLTSGIRYTHFRIAEPYARTLKFVSDAKFEVLLDLSSPMQPQIETYKRFMQNKPSGTVITEYVDVRMPGKIFYK